MKKIVISLCLIVLFFTSSTPVLAADPLTPFGGKILFTLNCENRARCATNIICLFMTCLAQQEFILHFIHDYTSNSDDADPAKPLKDNYIEPHEFRTCPQYCTVNPYCLIYCGTILPALQSQDSSPADLIIDGIISSLPVKPAIILVKDPFLGFLPACEGFGNILGKGFGQGFITTEAPPAMSIAGDSCRGNYYWGF